jgi:iron complex transport system substrate-binding protein
MITLWRQFFRSLSGAVLAVALGSCGQSPSIAPAQTAGRAARIVSLDYCADQFVLKLVDRDRILAVSPDAQRPFSYMRSEAEGVAQVRPSAEDVLALQPDLIVRSYGGGPNASAFYERAGVPVVNVGWAPDIAAVKRVVLELAAAFGERERGSQVVSQMDQRLAQIQQSSEVPNALYMTPSGVTSGPGSLIHDMLLAAGLQNYQSAPGWRSLPLEQIAAAPPEMVAAAFFDTRNNHKSGWSAMRHPVARKQLEQQPTVFLEGAWTSCSGWYLLDAIEALAQARPGL